MAKSNECLSSPWPISQLDETDTKNESYICFRRRESKAVRKTRAQQATYSDKMIRLQSELATAMELATSVLQREGLKREAANHGSGVWESRFLLIDLKRKFPTLGAKEDEELFYDRERVPKKIKPEMHGYVIVGSILLPWTDRALDESQSSCVRATQQSMAHLLPWSLSCRRRNASPSSVRRSNRNWRSGRSAIKVGTMSST